MVSEGERVCITAHCCISLGGSARSPDWGRSGKENEEVRHSFKKYFLRFSEISSRQDYVELVLENSLQSAKFQEKIIIG